VVSDRLGEQVLLDIHVFENRFDDQITASGVRQLGRTLNAPQYLLDLLGPKDLPFDALSQSCTNAVEPLLHKFGPGVDHDNREALLGHFLSQTATHVSCTYDSDLFHF